MTDKITPQARSRNMSNIRSKDTLPEKKVRSWLHAHGFRFRIHRKDLPGKPDIVLPKYKSIIFVHGCFWHRHEGCKEASVPKTNSEYWEKKIARNIERDSEEKQKLESAGWKVIVVWECEVDDSSFSAKILQEIDRNANFGH